MHAFRTDGSPERTRHGNPLERSVGRRLHATPALLALAAAGLIVACDDDPATPLAPEMLVLDLSGFEPLANDYHYEGWAIIDGDPLSTGKFNVNDAGMIVTLDGATIQDGVFETDMDLSATEAVVITIEPAGDTDAMPASTKVAGGAISAGQATLAVGDSRALGSDFSNASGGFILNTPTDAAAPFYAGVWFLEVTDDGPMAALELPSLPDGWRYEGWAVVDGQPVTTGTFLEASGVDDTAPFSGSDPGPPFPGEDFVQNAPSGLTFPPDLRGMMAVISIEPNPDDSAAPFTLKPLLGTAAEDAEAGESNALGNMAGDFPAGTAEIR